MSKISNTLENNSFFMHLRLRRKFRGDYMEVGDSKVGIALQDC